MMNHHLQLLKKTKVFSYPFFRDIVSFMLMEVCQRLRWLDVEGGRIDLNTGMTDKDVLGNCYILTSPPLCLFSQLMPLSWP